MSEDTMVTACSVLRTNRRRVLLSDSSDDDERQPGASSTVKAAHVLSMRSMGAHGGIDQAVSADVDALAVSLHASHIGSRTPVKTPGDQDMPMRIMRTVRKTGRAAYVLHDSDDDDVVRRDDRIMTDAKHQATAAVDLGPALLNVAAGLSLPASPAMVSAASRSMGAATSSAAPAEESCASSSKPRQSSSPCASLIHAQLTMPAGGTPRAEQQEMPTASVQPTRPLSPLRLGHAWPPWSDDCEVAGSMSMASNSAAAEAAVPASHQPQGHVDDDKLDDALSGGEANCREKIRRVNACIFDQLIAFTYRCLVHGPTIPSQYRGPYCSHSRPKRTGPHSPCCPASYTCQR